jgi:hypothetical protein
MWDISFREPFGARATTRLGWRPLIGTTGLLWTRQQVANGHPGTIGTVEDHRVARLELSLHRSKAASHG